MRRHLAAPPPRLLVGIDQPLVDAVRNLYSHVGLAVHAEFEVTGEQVAEIRDAAAGGEKVLRWFSTDLTDDRGEVVARVRKQIYVRRKRDAVAQGPSDADAGNNTRAQV